MLNFSTFVQKLKHKLRVARALNELSQRVRQPRAPKPHGLPHPLVVSLTSYSARFPVLELTLKGILHQSVGADKTILWVSRADYANLPESVLALRNEGLEIAQCEDLKSFKKIIPTLQLYPDSFIVTLDDDVYYRETLLEELISAYDSNNPAIICHRAHEVTVGASGLPRPYAEWKKIRSERRSPLVFPTGVMGVLYPPGVFHEDVCNEDLFQALCPTADDVWLYWMWRLKGNEAKKIGGRTRILEWPSSQSVNLRSPNTQNGGNDACIARLVARYGLPGFAASGPVPSSGQSGS